MKSKYFLITLVFLTFFVMFFAGCQRVEDTAIVEKSEEFIDSGVIIIETVPSSAQVYIDGELKGDTPLTLYNLPVGSYELLIKKEGYKDFQKTVTVKVGKTEEVDATLTPITSVKSGVQQEIEQKKPVETAMQNIPAPELNKINLSSFAMYYDFENIQFTEIRTSTSDLFSRKYDTYIDFIALTPVKIYLLNKPIRDVKKEDCIFTDVAVAQLYSDQTLCLKIEDGSTIAIGGSWQTMPSELEWVVFS